MDKFRDSATDFYKDLQKGRAEHADFERHIYGQYGRKSYYKDAKDEATEKTHLEKKKIQHDFEHYIETEKARQAQAAAERR